MDKTKLSKMIATKQLISVVISSTVSEAEREKVLRDFIKRTRTIGDGEIILVAVHT